LNADNGRQSQEHTRGVRGPAAPGARTAAAAAARRRLANHRLATTGAQRAQDEEIHGGNDGEGNGIGEREERQEQSRPVDLPDTTDNEIKQKLERELRPA